MNTKIYNDIVSGKSDNSMTVQNAGSKAKGYQVRQLRAIILKHNL